MLTSKQFKQLEEIYCDKNEISKYNIPCKDNNGNTFLMNKREALFIPKFTYDYNNPKSLKMDFIKQEHNCDKMLNIFKLEQYLKDAPKTGKCEICDECNGEGNVLWNYKDKSGETQSQYFRCPECLGEGYNESETELVIDENLTVLYIKTILKVKALLNIIKTAKIFNLKEIPVIFSNRNILQVKYKDYVLGCYAGYIEKDYSYYGQFMDK